MAANLINAKPYDFISTGTSDITRSTESVDSKCEFNDTILGIAYNKTGKSVSVAHDGDIVSLGCRGKWYYDYATDGGAIGAITLRGPKLPAGAVITRAFYRVLTTLTSATDAATGSLGILVDDVAGIKAAIAISNGANPWDAGNVECIQTGAASAFSEITTAERDITFTIAVEALTAGAFVLVCDYEVLVADTTV